MSSAKHPLQRPWTYWELRQPWVKPKQDWNALPTPLFTVATAEDFFACYNRSPKIIEVFDDGRSGPNNVVEREEKGEPGGKVKTGVQGYMLFRKDFVPETSFEVDGERKHLNGYRTEVSCSGKDFENFQKAWETVVLAVIGEVVDPGEYINGVYLTDKHRGKSAALRLEIWFGEKDNAICEAICGEIRALLAEESSLPFRFQQMPYYEGKTGGGGGGGGYARRPKADRDDGGGGGYGGGGYGGGDRDRGDRGDRGDRRDDRGGGGGRRDDRDGGGRRDGGFGGGGGGYGGGGGRSGYGATDPRDRRAGPGGFGR